MIFINRNISLHTPTTHSEFSDNLLEYNKDDFGHQFIYIVSVLCVYLLCCAFLIHHAAHTHTHRLLIKYSRSDCIFCVLCTKFRALKQWPVDICSRILNEFENKMTYTLPPATIQIVMYVCQTSTEFLCFESLQLDKMFTIMLCKCVELECSWWGIVVMSAICGWKK